MDELSTVQILIDSLIMLLVHRNQTNSIKRGKIIMPKYIV